MRIAVASGKGGTGKTLVATNMAWLLAERGVPTAYLDADVEEPNGYLFLGPSWEEERRHTVEVPILANGACSGCGECQDFCVFNALVALDDRILVFPELCHSCGGCVLTCPERALVTSPREVGTVRRGRAGKVTFSDGVLDVGEARAAPLVDAVLEGRVNGTIGIVDAPPGTSCPVMAAVRGADLVLLVTEPTPFGLHDLDLAARMCNALKLPVAAVINRSDLGNGDVREYLSAQSIPLFGEIPFDREIASICAKGGMAAREIDHFRNDIDGLVDRVLDHLGEPVL